MIRKHLKLVNITKKGNAFSNLKKRNFIVGLSFPLKKKLHQVKLKKQRKTNC